MIEIRRDGAELHLVVETDFIFEAHGDMPSDIAKFPPRTVIFRRQCGGELEAHLLEKYVKNLIGDRVQQIRIKAFEDGKVIEKSEFERDF